MDSQEIIVKPSYVPFLGSGLKTLMLATILVIVIAKSVTPPLPEPLSIAVTEADALFLLIGIVTFIIGVVRRNSYTYILNRLSENRCDCMNPL